MISQYFKVPDSYTFYFYNFIFYFTVIKQCSLIKSYLWVYIRLTFITFTTFTQLLVLIYPKFKLRNIDLMVWMKQVFYGFVNSVIFHSDLMTELTNDWKVDTWPCFSLETKTVPCTNLVFCQLLVISVTTKICKIIFTLVLYFLS